MTQNTKSPWKRIIAFLLLLLIAVGAYFAYANRYTIQNWWLARDYRPDNKILALEEHIQLTDAGLLVFHSTHPTISTGAAFRTGCAAVTHTESGHVVGCYTSEHRIHLFDVTDLRISGIVEVTAVHEMLHAVWQQTPDNRELSKWLLDYYENHASEQLRTRMEVYADLPQAEFTNELHSVLGTEVADLPAELEAHYAQYIVDRSAIVAIFDRYHAVFTTIQEEAAQLEAEMRQLRETVELERGQFETRVQMYNSAVQEFNERNRNYGFATNPEEFYRISDQYRAQREQLLQTRSEIQAKIDHYEQLRLRLVQLSETSQELNNLLDSNLSNL